MTCFKREKRQAKERERESERGRENRIEGERAHGKRRTQREEEIATHTKRELVINKLTET